MLFVCSGGVGAVGDYRIKVNASATNLIGLKSLAKKKQQVLVMLMICLLPQMERQCL